MVTTPRPDFFYNPVGSIREQLGQSNVNLRSLKDMVCLPGAASRLVRALIEFVLLGHDLLGQLCSSLF